jgi:hypothetical protein
MPAVADEAASLNAVRELLTKTEAKQMTVGPSITTVTFMRGDPTAAAASLQARLGEVIAANPWLAGSLEGKCDMSEERLSLVWQSEPLAARVAVLFNPTLRGGKQKPALSLSSAMSYFDVCAAVGGSAAEILTGAKCANKPEPLLALSVVPDALRPADGFAVIFSVSHVIADGHTYYKLLSMLSADGIVEPMAVARKHEFEEALVTAMGAEEHKWAYSGSVMCNVVCGLICGGKPLIESYHIDEARIAAAKEAGAKEDGVEFVSTNDILTSSWANATSADALLMPINFREKLPAYTPNDAGNYEGALVFGAADFLTPGALRKTLSTGPPTYKRGGGAEVGPLPGGLKARISMVTSWVFPSFSALSVEGAEQLLHMPHCDVKMVPFEIAVVYRPQAGKIAVVYFTRAIDSAGLKSECPVGTQVLSADEC